jgi:hypothetical protein
VSGRYRCPGVGRHAGSGRMGALDPTAPCPVCAHRARVRLDGTVGAHTLGEAEYRRVSGTQPQREDVGTLTDEVGIRLIYRDEVEAGSFHEGDPGVWIDRKAMGWE